MVPEDVCIMGGNCTTDSGFFNHTETQKLGQCAIDSMDKYLGAHFMWTAHNEIEAKWDYIRAYDLAWINRTEVKNETLPETMFQVNPALIFNKYAEAEALFLD